MPISSSCIFHYTNKPTTLYKILENKCFLPSYCKEKSGLDRNTFVRVPMISFCDIPLTQTANITSYGKYAIGMKVEWAIKNQLNPIFYLPENSLVFERNKKLVEKFDQLSKINQAKKSIDQINNEWVKLGLLIFSKEISAVYSPELKVSPQLIEPLQKVYLSFFQNIKEYEGVLEREGAPGKKYKFYDEREWRFIPTIESTKAESFPPFINETEWNKTMKFKFGEKPHFKVEHGLPFTANDIDYIIVDKEKGIKPLISKLKKLFPKNHEVLLTKISSFDRIKKDF